MIKRKIVLGLIMIASSIGIIAYMSLDFSKESNYMNSNPLKDSHLKIQNSKIPEFISNSPIEQLVYTSHYLSKLQGASSEAHSEFNNISRSWANFISKNHNSIKTLDLKIA